MIFINKNDIIEKLVDKSLTKQQLLDKIKLDNNLIPNVVKGMLSKKAAIRYGCGKVLLDISSKEPTKLYQYFDFFVEILDSKYRILTWQAMGIIANLTSVDDDKKFEMIFKRYYKFINDEYMVTVANLVKYSGKIANNKPNLIPNITKELLKLDKLKTTPHLTNECKRVIIESAIVSFDMFFDKIDKKQEVILFVKKHVNSPRKNLKIKAKNFLIKWNK